MSVGEYCNREVVIAQRNTDIREAAKLMRAHHVGDLVIVEQRGEDRVPVGIVTDRDLVIEVLAQEVAPESITVGDIMAAELAVAREGDGLWDTLNRMRSLGVRRMPVVSASGSLVGILTVDDVLELLAEGLGDLAGLIRREMRRESSSRP
ncbi:MAG TPA: CBS domain-containing protein [Candidatus Competibacteraceae bacterium]|nr:CBS domain-containing protein [Candidatus Competibacteraceae bacterium]